MASTEETSDQFGKKMNGLVTSSYVGIGVAYGEILGLFEMLATFDQPKTAEEIATLAKLKERYVREWLALMVVGDIIDADSTGTTFFLPVHRRKHLTKESGVNNFALVAAGIPTFMNGFQHVIEASKQAGPKGFPQSETAVDFFMWMDRWTEAMLSKTLFTSIVPLIPGFRQGMESGTTVLSIGCGAGIDSVMLAEAFPKTSILGIDIDPVPIQKAKKNASDKGLNNVNFEVHDAAKLPADWSDKFDYMTSNYSVHDAGRPDLVMKEIYRVLKPGGFFLMVEYSASANVVENKGRAMMEFLYCASLLHCIPTSLCQEGGMGLGVCWGEKMMVDMLKSAGFENMEIKEYPGFNGLVAILCNK